MNALERTQAHACTRNKKTAKAASQAKKVTNLVLKHKVLIVRVVVLERRKFFVPETAGLHVLRIGEGENPLVTNFAERASHHLVSGLRTGGERRRTADLTSLHMSERPFRNVGSIRLALG